MEGLASLLLFAGLFYFMMRFGCGAHAVHGHGGGGHAGHGGGSGGPPPVRASTRDPVCGMDVAPGQGYTTSHDGRDYRLCSRACLDRFEANPDLYAIQGGLR